MGDPDPPSNTISVGSVVCSGVDQRVQTHTRRHADYVRSRPHLCSACDAACCWGRVWLNVWRWWWLIGSSSYGSQHVQRWRQWWWQGHVTARTACVRTLEQQGGLLSGLQRDRRRHTGRDGTTGRLRTQGTPRPTTLFHRIIIIIIIIIMLGARATVEQYTAPRQFTCLWLHRLIFRTCFRIFPVIF